MIKKNIIFIGLIFVSLTIKSVNFSLVSKDLVVIKKLIEAMPLTNENLSAVMVTFNLLERNDPNFFKAELDSFRIKLFDQICLHQKVTNGFDLQAVIDYWYLTKLLGFGDKYRPNMLVLQPYFTKKHIATLDNPVECLLYWIIIKAMQFCDPVYIAPVVDLMPQLEKFIAHNETAYLYLLTHKILYESEFGSKKLEKSTKIIIKNLEKRCKKNKWIIKNYDLMAEIVICAKLCDKNHRKIFKKFEYILNQVQSTESFHEYCTIFLACYL